MSGIKELYRKNVYGVMGTLIFHILLVTVFLIAEMNLEVKYEKEEAILLDFTAPEETPPIVPKEKEEQLLKSTASNNQEATSNRAVNDAAKPSNTKNDRFFDESYKRDIEQAKKMVVDVNKQLAKKAPSKTKFEMPEATTEGQDPDSIKNVVHSGKSNIHYYLENRYHVRLPIPVYLAKSGGLVTIDIQVDRSGRVVKADARPVKNLADPMLIEYAVQAAERTLFNRDPKAPAIQRGNIVYKFVAQ